MRPSRFFIALINWFFHNHYSFILNREWSMEGVPNNHQDPSYFVWKRTNRKEIKKEYKIEPGSRTLFSWLKYFYFYTERFITVTNHWRAAIIWPLDHGCVSGHRTQQISGLSLKREIKLDSMIYLVISLSGVRHYSF